MDELQSIADTNGAIRVDGEIIGDILYVFDLRIHQGIRLHPKPWLRRMQLATNALAECHHVKALPVSLTQRGKLSLWLKVKAAHGEGVVFKLVDSPVTAGRPNSGGDWLKFKFTESASCYVLEVNVGRRSVRIGLLETSTRRH